MGSLIAVKTKNRWRETDERKENPNHFVTLRNPGIATPELRAINVALSAHFLAAFPCDFRLDFLATLH
ncbi:hypothetical protein ACU8OG_20980 [Rhizobium leguminosarum]